MIEKKCEVCGKNFTTNLNKTKTCSPSCATTLGNMKKREKSLKQWLETGKLEYKPNTMIKVGSIYRDYINEEQNGKCAICGISDIWNNNHLVFILDHIDGNSNNHCRNNLRLVCPNCDSQLSTYKSKNKNSGRDYRVYKNKG